MITFVHINALVGRVLTSVEHNQEEVVFTCQDGDRFRLYHEQCCCESVTLEGVDGDVEDLIGVPVIRADEVLCEQFDRNGSSQTDTHFLVATNAGRVLFRWEGASNGYYSELVYFSKIE